MFVMQASLMPPELGVEVGECREVSGGFASCTTPRPLSADAFGEPQIQDHIEAVVGRLRDRAQQAVDLRRTDRSVADLADQVDVTERIQAEGNAVQLHVALQQPFIDGLVILIRPPGDKCPHLEGVDTDLKGAISDQLSGAGDADREQSGLRLAPRHIKGTQSLPYGGPRAIFSLSLGDLADLTHLADLVHLATLDPTLSPVAEGRGVLAISSAPEVSGGATSARPVERTSGLGRCRAGDHRQLTASPRSTRPRPSCRAG